MNGPLVLEVAISGGKIHDPLKADQNVILADTNVALTNVQAVALANTMRDIQWCGHCYPDKAEGG